MPNKMLIDASHPEETRVVVLRGNRIEEFDFESANKKQLRGNIYLAKVTRVEPSLQAAFVEYGGNRHGFLAFSEIHPDYYQIPVADRLALLEEDARHRAEEEDEEPRTARRSRRNRRGGRDRSEKRATRTDDSIFEDAADESGDASGGGAVDGASGSASNEFSPPAIGEEATSYESSPAQTIGEIAYAEERAEHPSIVLEPPAPHVEQILVSEGAPLSPIGEIAAAEKDSDARLVSSHGDAVSDEADEEQRASDHEGAGEAGSFEARRRGSDDEDDSDEEEEEQIEQIGGDDFEEMPSRKPRLRRQYKIQEVIKRRQVLLVQVVKEERGNKGAALTTYLSLAGRYSVLMPNTARGGGISRKITDAEDRKRLKSIAQELDVPEGMGVILRTAGAARTKQEVRRDFEYLLRMWETVRELTLKSSAPTLVYEEGSLIKRAIRDLYNKDIDEVLVSGDEGYREAHDFMRMLMPSHARNVISFREPQPLFAKFGVEAQLDSMFSNQVTLKSGGYLVINPTEALVAIDVNSGRSTREHNIEDTALRTNLEAADEVARQLRLRDLAGLIVVDFIDMEEGRNNRAVERRIKEALKNDRARIQVGRISHFGLLEMSRQRIRTGVLEGSTVVCPHCSGSGSVRSTASIALHVLRVLEDALIKSAAFNMTVRTRTQVALYILNQKRTHLRDIEDRFGVSITVAADDTLMGSTYHILERGEPATLTPRPDRRSQSVRLDTLPPADFEEEEELPVEEAAEDGEVEGEDAEGFARGEDAEGDVDSDGQRRKRRRRRRRGRGVDREASGIQAEAPQPSDDALGLMAAEIVGQSSFDLGPIEPGAVSDGEVDEIEASSESGFEGRRERFSRRRRGRGRGRFSAERPADEASRDDAAPLAADSLPGSEMNPAFEQPMPLSSSAYEAREEPAEAAAPKPQQPPASNDQWLHEPPAVSHAQSAPVDLPEAEPPIQKRSGWWQRAKATFGGS